MSIMEQTLTPKQLGEILGLKRSKIHQMITSGEIPSLMVSKGQRRRIFRVRISELEKWMKAREVHQ